MQVDVDELEELAQGGPVRAMPTFMAFKNGKKVGELVGANKDSLSKLVADNK